MRDASSDAKRPLLLSPDAASDIGPYGRAEAKPPVRPDFSRLCVQAVDITSPLTGSVVPLRELAMMNTMRCCTVLALFPIAFAMPTRNQASSHRWLVLLAFCLATSCNGLLYSTEAAVTVQAEAYYRIPEARPCACACACCCPRA